MDLPDGILAAAINTRASAGTHVNQYKQAMVELCVREKISVRGQHNGTQLSVLYEDLIKAVKEVAGSHLLGGEHE